MSRKIKQISAVPRREQDMGAILYALDEDGGVWAFAESPQGGAWRRLPALPDLEARRATPEERAARQTRAATD